LSAKILLYLFITMIQIKEFIKHKKVLVVGLGILGGGISTCLWLLKHKAKLTITDLKSKKI